MQKITPFLWFDGHAEEAMNFYVSIFKNSKVLKVTRYGEAGPGPKGTVMSATFQLEGQNFYALNGGPQFSFTPAISFFVNCQSQQEVDELWEKLSEGGQKERCGWLKDKYGLSWQIIPSALGEMLGDKDPVKASRVMQAMLQMNKIDIKGLSRHTTGDNSAQTHRPGAPSFVFRRVGFHGRPSLGIFLSPVYAASCARVGSKTISLRVLSTIAFSSACSVAGTANLSSVCWKSSKNASHSSPVIFKWECDSAIDLPVYFCGPPVAQQTISVTKYLNPAGGTR